MQVRLNTRRPVPDNPRATPGKHLWSSAVVLTVTSMLLYYVVGVVESGRAAPGPPGAATDSDGHLFQVASRDS